MRPIRDILYFRSDLSPFLVHLTRSAGPQVSAKQVFEKILADRKLVCGDGQVSDARFGRNTMSMAQPDKRRFFSAICLTETPLDEVHCLLEIDKRQVNLEPYGLAFLKDCLTANYRISPVHNFNNVGGQSDSAIRSLCGLIDGDRHAAAEILPLVSVFGRKVTPPGATAQTGDVDFTWEREWRLPSSFGDIAFTPDDVFVGFCRDEEIDHFEASFQPVRFIDPTRNIKWYASKLVAARQRVNLKYSVV